MREYEGTLRGDGKKFAIVASRFNGFVVDSLVKGADLALRKMGVKPDAISVPRAVSLFVAPIDSPELHESVSFAGQIGRGDGFGIDWARAAPSPGSVPSPISSTMTSA